MMFAAAIALALGTPSQGGFDQNAIEQSVAEVLATGLYPGLSVAVSRDGSLIYSGQFGQADLANRRAPGPDTAFRMYSVSKGLTQILAAVLVDEGVLDLNSPISRYLPNLPEHLGKLTANQLINHRSGIRHYSGAKEWLALSQQHCTSPSEAFAAFQGDPLLFEPGAKESYSSFGYVLLSAVLEKAGKASFADLLAQKVVRPSGATKVQVDKLGRSLPNTSLFYERREGAKQGFDVAPAVDNSCKFGGGAVNATPTDISRIFSAFYGGKLTSSQSLHRFVPAIAEGSANVISFGGEGLGGRSVVVAVPARNVVVTIAANARGGSLEPLGRKIAELVDTERRAD